jgi:hypothetical protein
MSLKKTEIEREKMKDLIVIIYYFFLNKAYGWHSFSKFFCGAGVGWYCDA